MKLAMPDGLAQAAATLGVKLEPHFGFDPVDAIGSLRDQFGADVFADCFGADDFGWERDREGDQETEILEVNYELAAELMNAFGHDPDLVPLIGQDAFGFGLPKFLSKKVKKLTVKPLTAKLMAKATTPQQKAAVQALARAPLKVNVKKTVTGLAKGIGKGIAIASFVVPGAGPLLGGAGLAALGAADKLLSDPRIKNAAAVVKNTQALAALGSKPAQRGAATLAAASQIRIKLGTPAGKPAIPLKTVAQKAAVAAVLPKTVAKVTPAQVKALATKAVAIKKPGFWSRLLAVFNLKSAA